MKKLVYILMCIGISFLSLGQKKGINYQAVILDPKPLDIPGNQITGQPLQKGKVAIKFTISSVKGLDYVEIQQTETDEFGLINLTIGLAPTNGSLISSLSSESGAHYSSFDAIVWDEFIKKLAVAVSFDNGKTFTEVSNQKLSYTAYALYAESVDYKNVRDAPTKLSQFSNDPGYLISKDLEPIKADIQSHTSQIKITNQTIDENKKNNDAAFLIVNQSITSLDAKLAENSTAIKEHKSSISTIVTKLAEQQNQISATNNNLNSQIGGLQGQIRETNDNVNNLSGTAEVVSNKSTEVDLGGSNPSDQLYPSQKATKTYVDQNISSLVAGNIPDATTLAPGKIQLAGDLGGTATNPTVPALANKENSSNKSTNIQGDAGSDSKYPSVKAVKTYVDQATMGTALQATVDGKADKNSPTFTGTPVLPTGTTGFTQSAADNSTKLATTAFVQAATAGIALQAAVDAKADKNSPTFTGTPILPTGTIAVTQSAGDNSTNIATTAFVQQATAAGVIDASTSLKGKLKLAGDLAGTAELPTVPGLALKANATDVTNSLALKEDAANKSTATDLGSTGASDVLFPSQKAVKIYVDTQVATKSIVDADAVTKGKIQLAGDLAGTAASPTVPGLALKAPIESPTFTGTIAGISKSMVGLSNVDNTSDADKPISSATATALSTKAIASEVTSSLALKAPLDSPTFTGTPSLPTGTTASTQTPTDNSTKLATTAFVQQATAAGVIDASTSLKGKLKLAGDLAGTAELPTVPGLVLKANAADVKNSLALKEDVANKSNAALGTSTTLFPTQSAVKTYVDAQVSTATIVDADASTKGKIQLAGDFTGTAASPAVTSGAINSTKILDGTIATADLADASVTDAKIAGISGSKVTGNIAGNSANVSGVVAVANGGTGASTKISGFNALSPMTTKGDLIYGENSGEGTRLPKGSEGQVLTMKTGLPSWQTPTNNNSNDNDDDDDDDDDGKTVNDADSDTKGIIQLSGDLTGSASSPAIATGAINSAKILNGSIATVDLADAAVTDVKIATVSGSKITGNIAGNSANVSGIVAVANGGTGATTLTGYLKGTGTSALTASASIPVADVTGAAPLNSPTFTGTPSLPTGTTASTQTSTDNSTKLATTAFVQLATAGGVIDASASAKGKLKLAGDLAGTADLPTVPGLALKANTATVTSSLALKEDVSNKSNAALGTSTMLFPTQSAVKTYVDAQNLDASSSVKGKIQLAGDLTGSAASPAIATGAITSTKILNGTIATEDLANASVTSDKIADGTITTADLADRSITTDKIVDGTIATVDLANSSVTDVKISAVAGSKVTGNITGNAANVSGTVAVANGGTGATALASNQVLLGNGTSAIQTVAPGNSGNVLMSNGTTWVSSSNTSDNTTHTVGESYGGGIIFYVYDGGKHGLIAATSDQSSDISWDVSSGNETRARANGIGAGIKNTTLIISSEISQRKYSFFNDRWSYNGEDFAATICNEYFKSETVNSLESTYGDWYLPSKYELNLLYLRRSTVGNFASDKYWSSTEYDEDKAWSINFNTSTVSAEDKNNKNRVRAIRNF